MGMHLRIQGAARVLPEPCSDDPVGIKHAHPTRDPVAGMRVGFDPAGQRADGGVVRACDFVADVLVTESEQHGHGLRCRARHIKPTYRLLRIHAAERTVRIARMRTSHHGDERVGIEHVAEAERGGAVAEPHTGRLTRLQVVVREMLHVIQARIDTTQRRDTHRHAKSPITHDAAHDDPMSRVHPSVLASNSSFEMLKEFTTATCRTATSGPEQPTYEHGPNADATSASGSATVLAKR